MNFPLSCSLLSISGFFPPAQFAPERVLHFAADSAAMGHLPDVFVRKAQAAGDIRNNAADAGSLSEFDADRCRIHGGYQLSERETYAEQRIDVNRKMRLSIKADPRGAVGKAFRAARKERGLTQAQLAEMFGYTQTAVYRWERDENRPPVEAIRRLGAMVSAERKETLFSAAGIAEEQNFGVVAISASACMIPLHLNPDLLGDPTADMGYALSLPGEWLPRDAKVEATKFTQRISPFISGQLIALVDIAHTDPDRLNGCVVAVRTGDGTEPMTLHKDGSDYLLVPLQESPAHRARVYRHGGDWKIVGQVLKWIGDAPSPRK